MTGKYRIAFVRYLNTRPLVEGLDALDEVELVPAVPAQIADMVRSGQVDVGLGSIIDGTDEALSVLPAGMIGCDGPTRTVRLYATVPFAQVTHLAADSESHTSVVLSRIVLEEMYGSKPQIEPFDATAFENEGADGGGCGCNEGEGPQAVLLIGDKVVADLLPADRYGCQLDLGQAWKDLTGLPFVYASWLCRREEASSDRLIALGALLHRQLLHNLTRLDWIVATHARSHNWNETLARQYVRSLLSYRLGDRERAAADRFVSLARLHGFLPENAKLNWVEMDAVLAQVP